jgi:hypothetical protein
MTNKLNGSYSQKFANFNQEAVKISHLLETNTLTRNESTNNSQSGGKRKNNLDMNFNNGAQDPSSMNTKYFSNYYNRINN